MTSRRNYFIFDGVSSKDYGVYISGAGTFDGAERDVSTIGVPGRNGELTIDNGRYKNRQITYPAFIYRNFDLNIEGLRNWLLSGGGYKRLEDSYHPNEFYMARLTGTLDPDVVDKLVAGKMNLTFDCYPQRFLKSGEMPIDITAAATLINETAQIAKPLIRAYGTGTITVNSQTLTISTADEYTDLDCDLMEAYKGATNCNGNVSGTFPEFIPGANSISMTSGITQMSITPRWWIL